MTDIGAVILGMPDAPLLPWDPSSVYALASADLETWGRVTWPIPNAAHPTLVDPMYGSSAVYGSWEGQYILVCAVRKSVYTGEGS